MTVARCPFCDYAGPSEVLRDYGDAYVIEPLDPVTDGHLLVIPKQHQAQGAMMFSLVGRAFAAALEEATRRGYASYNLILSVGTEATQTVEHLHVHIVPRREGDGLQLPWGLPRR